MHPREAISILKDAAFDWVDDGAMRLSSSLAYYAIFSLAPLLVIVISIAGLVFGEDAARGQLSQQIATLAARGRAKRSVSGAVERGAEIYGHVARSSVLRAALGPTVFAD